MKNFFKKVAFVLALAMVLSNIGPAARVSAAEAPGLKYTSRVIYVGDSAFGDYTDNCWTPSKNTEGYKVTYEVTTGKNLIDVATNGRITATGNGIGKAVVRVTYTPENGGKETTANFTVKVRRNATDVRLTNATIAKVEETLSIGTEIELIAAKSWTTPVSYAKGNYGLDNYMGVVSDQITYESDNTDVIKVEGNKLTVVGNGAAKLTVKAYEYGDKTQSPVVDKSYPITVVGGIIEVNQKSLTTLEVVFGHELESIETEDFSITLKDSTITYDIKSVELSSDKKIVKVETWLDMTDGYEFTLKHDENEYSFTASSGVVADIAINRTSIPYGIATYISFNLVDMDGIIIDTITYTTARTDIEIDVETSDGFMDGDRLYLYEKGKKATINLTYKTGELDNDGNTVGDITKKFEVIAADIIADSIYKSTITGNRGSLDWNSVTEDRTMYAEDTGRYLHVLATDEAGADMTQAYGYYLESSNEDILIIGNSVQYDYINEFVGVEGMGIYADIYGVKAGTANVIVRNLEGKQIKTIPITVKSVKKYNSYSIDTSTITISNTAGGAGVVATFRDQYGNEYSMDDTPVFELVTSPDNGMPSTVGGGLWWGASNYGYWFEGLGASPGTYRYKITYEGVTKYVNVIVKEPKGSDSYKIEIDPTSFDLNAGHDAGGKNINIKLAHYKGGVLYGYISFDDTTDETITRNSKTEGDLSVICQTVTGDTISITARTVSGSNMDTSGNGGKEIIKNIETGSYRISLKYNGNTYNGSFTITDTQPSLTATTNKTSTVSSDLDDMFKDLLTFRYGGKILDDDAEAGRMRIVSVLQGATASSITSSTPSVSTLSPGTYYVKSIEVQYYVRNINRWDQSDSHGRWITFIVPVNRTITITR